MISFDVGEYWVRHGGEVHVELLLLELYWGVHPLGNGVDLRHDFGGEQDMRSSPDLQRDPSLFFIKDLLLLLQSTVTENGDSEMVQLKFEFFNNNQCMVVGTFKKNILLNIK